MNCLWHFICSKHRNGLYIFGLVLQNVLVVQKQSNICLSYTVYLRQRCLKEQARIEVE